MSDESAVAKALAQAEKDSQKELAINPEAATGSCTVRSHGWSQCTNDVTKAACDAQEAPGFTVAWVENGKC